MGELWLTLDLIFHYIIIPNRASNIRDRNLKCKWMQTMKEFLKCNELKSLTIDIMTPLKLGNYIL